MAYTATQEGANYGIFQDGKRISTGTAATLSNYGLSPTNLGSTIPATTGVGNTASQPAAQSSVTPAPQPQTPPAPIVNINNAPQTGPQSQNSAPTATQQQGSTSTPSQQLQMPLNGSVVDLLNAAGQDSSYANRQKLAQQYGIQGYSGTASQNQELAKKYIDAFNANKSTTAPQSGADARSALDAFTQANPKATEQDPVKQFMDSFAAMNPLEASIFQQMSTLLSTQTNQQSLTDFYKQEVAAQGIPELNMQLADINKIMNGTEDDIRDEITNAGGFATESQVRALTGARNKNLIKQANYLSDVLNAKNDYVDHIVNLTQADRQQVSADLDRKLGLTKTLFDMTEKMVSNAKENYQMIVQTSGWGGLAASLKGNPTQTAKVENLFGLAPGELQALSDYKPPQTEEDKLKLQNLKLQNAKLAQDIGTGPSIQTQVVDVGGKKLLINAKTGATIKEITSGDTKGSVQQLAQAQQTIGDISSLLKDPNLRTAVGPSGLSRFDVANYFTAGKSNFVAGIEEIRQRLTLDNLQNAKANGATFGALSDGELNLLSQSASKLGTWAVKDKAGNVTGYRTNDAAFKQELDKINNFTKLDFILKGGDPAAAGLKEMPDGTLWSENSDGTYTKIM